MKPIERFQVSNDNEWDAAISAWYTLISVEQEAPRDLVDEFQADNAIYPVGKVQFYWPKLTNAAKNQGANVT